MIRPSQPSASELRTMLPMFTGLSIASAMTSRFDCRASSGAGIRVGRSNSATMLYGMPSLVMAARN
jgi:hypothetical protein